MGVRASERVCERAARKTRRNELSVDGAHLCSGCIIARDPHVEDEDEDPFLSDDYRCVSCACWQRPAIRGRERQGGALCSLTCSARAGGRQGTRGSRAHACMLQI